MEGIVFVYVMTLVLGSLVYEYLKAL